MSNTNDILYLRQRATPRTSAGSHTTSTVRSSARAQTSVQLPSVVPSYLHSYSRTTERSSRHVHTEATPAAVPALASAKQTTVKASRTSESPLEKFNSLYESHKRFVFVALILFTLICLYGPARDLYSARRDEQVYAAQLTSLNEENEVLRSSVDRLQSREGIEDEARRRGYVGAGEVSVAVPNVIDETGADVEASAPMQAQDTNPWYIKVLDVLFGYELPDLVAR